MLLKPAIIPRERRNDFYQRKYDHFKDLTVWMIIITCIIEMTFFVSDCSMVNGFSKETVLPRFLILVPLGLYLFTFKHVSSYKIMAPFSYVMIHACMLSVIWAHTIIGDSSALRETFLVMHLVFVVAGISAPKNLHSVCHILMAAEIVFAICVNNMSKIDTIISLGGAGLVSVCVFEVIFENAYAEQYNISKKLEDISLHDQLTGAFNRTKLKMLCMEESNELDYKKAGFILIDINDFKKINENFGHDAGDAIIKELYEIIKFCTRGGDVCIRMGDEQFLIIVPEQGLARTKEIGERIRAKVEKKNELEYPFKVSIGVAIYLGGDYHVTINLADKALKFAEENDVNIVVAYEDM